MLDKQAAIAIAAAYLAAENGSWSNRVQLMPERAIVHRGELVVPWNSVAFIEGDEEAELAGNHPIAVDLETGRCRDVDMDEYLLLVKRRYLG